VELFTIFCYDTLLRRSYIISLNNLLPHLCGTRLGNIVSHFSGSATGNEAKVGILTNPPVREERRSAMTGIPKLAGKQ
jgi:hypothetical protein